MTDKTTAPQPGHDDPGQDEAAATTTRAAAIAEVSEGQSRSLTADAFRFIVLEQLGQMNLAPDGVLIEPEGRNPAPAA